MSNIKIIAKLFVLSVWVATYQPVYANADEISCRKLQDSLPSHLTLNLKTNFDDCGFSDNRALVWDEKKQQNGFINRKGELIIPAIYDDALPFEADVSIVRKGNKYGLIDTNGNTVLPIEYKSIWNFQEGLARVEKEVYLPKTLENSEVIDYSLVYGYIDKNGKIVIPFEYEDAKSFSEGLASVKKNGKYGFIDKQNNTVIAFNYKYADSFEDGLAVAYVNDKAGYIDKNNKVVIPFQFCCAQGFFGKYAVIGRGDHYGIIDKKGKILIPQQLESYNFFSENLIAIKKAGKYQFLDGNLKPLTKPIYQEVYNFDNQLILVKKNEKYGILDYKLNEILPIKYDSIDYNDAYNGLYPISFNNKIGYIDNQGKIVIPLVYDYAEPFNGRLAKVSSNGKTKYIDQNNKQVIPVFLDQDDNFEYSPHKHLIVVKTDGKYGLYDDYGKTLLEPNYQSIEIIDDFIQAKKGNKYQIFDFNLKSIFNQTFDELKWFDIEDTDTQSVNWVSPGETLGAIGNDGKYLVITSKGKILLSELPYQIKGITEGLLIIKQNEKYGYMDKDSNIIIPLEYDGALGFNDGFAVVLRNKLMGVIDKSNNIILPIEYDYIENYGKGIFHVVKNNKEFYTDKTGKKIDPNLIH